MERNNRWAIWWDAATLVLLALTALMVLSVPQFPTQDGPVHLYYADILRGLLTHSGPYAQHFAMKWMMTPYALEYYALLALESVFPAAMSEKLLICAYIFAFGLGFRYLAAAVGARRGPWALVALPFCMNRILYMGFLNYCFGVTLVIFLTALWIRYWEQGGRWRFVLLLSGFVLLLLTHPVPVAVFLLFTGVHTAVSWGTMPRWSDRYRRAAWMAGMGAASLLWIGLFVDRTPHPPEPNYIQLYGWISPIMWLLNLSALMPFRAVGYRAGACLLFAVVGLALIVAGWRSKGRIGAPALSLLTISAACFALYCIAPIAINRGFYFPDRFPILWILFLIASLAAMRPARRWGMVAGALAIVATCGSLVQQWSFVRSFERTAGPALRAMPAKAGSVGLLLGQPKNMPDGFGFDPYRWAGVHYFRRSQAILANNPWMSNAYIILRPRDPDGWSFLEPEQASRSLAAATGETTFDFVVQNEPFEAAMDATLNRQKFLGSPTGVGSLRILARTR